MPHWLFAVQADPCVFFVTHAVPLQYEPAAQEESVAHVFSGALRVIHFGRREGSTRGIVGGCRGETKRKRGGGIVIHTAARWAGT